MNDTTATILTSQEVMENMDKIEQTSIKARATIRLRISNQGTCRDLAELSVAVDKAINDFAERASYDFDTLFAIAQDRAQVNETRGMAIACLTLIKVLDNKFLGDLTGVK